LQFYESRSGIKPDVAVTRPARFNRGSTGEFGKLQKASTGQWSETMKAAGSRRPLVPVMLCLAMLCVLTALAAGALNVANAANGSVAYGYDALGRVTTASYDTGVCIVYKYDANGNRLSETITIATTGTTGVWGCFNWNASGGALWGP
jgi:YD repeat-containing protein